MTEVLARRLRLLAFLLLCCAGTLLAGWQMRDWGDALSPVDAYSEANALREVDGFRAQGIGHDSGLGNVLFGSRYPDDGFAATHGDRRARSLTPSGVYTHYPPGPEYLLYAAEAVFGPGPVSRLRLLPLACCGAASLFFGLSLRRRFGETAAWLVMLASLAVVPLHDANSSVHLLGYALALLLVETGVAIGRNRLWVPFVLLGFAQGWLSFDYVFLAVLVPLGTELSLRSIDPDHAVRWRLALGRCLLVGAGFAVAQLLHFCEVWSFYGTLSDAIADLHSAARYRAGADEAQDAASIQTAVSLIYFYVVSPYPVALPLWSQAPEFFATHAFRFLGLTLGMWWPLVAVILGGIDVRRREGGLPPLGLLRRWSVLGLVGLGMSCVWWLVMQNHATVHVHLLYRHLSVCFLLWATFLAVQAAEPMAQWQARWRAARAGARRPLVPALAIERPMSEA